MKYLGIGFLLLLLGVVATACIYSWVTNPRVIRELREDPDGERARKVMLLSTGDRPRWGSG